MGCLFALLKLQKKHAEDLTGGFFLSFLFLGENLKRHVHLYSPGRECAVLEQRWDIDVTDKPDGGGHVSS